MNYDLENLSLELNGVTENLMLVSNQFGKVNEPCGWSNQTISETLFSIAKHLERIGDDLDDYIVHENFIKTLDAESETPFSGKI